MKTLCLCVLAIVLALACNRTVAEDIKTANGKEYKNVTVTRVEPDGIVLRTKSGIVKLYSVELPKELQERYWPQPSPQTSADNPVPPPVNPSAAIPASWLEDTPEARRLRDRAEDCFPSAPVSKDALLRVIQRLPGIEKYTPNEAHVILEPLCDPPLRINPELSWRLFSKVQEEWSQAGIPGSCLLFLAKQFDETLIGTEVNFELSGKTLDWNSPEAQVGMLSIFDGIVWAAKEEAIRELVAFGSVISNSPWEEVKAIKLTDGKLLGEEIKTLKEEVASRDNPLIGIPVTLGYIVENLPATSPFSATEVLKRSRNLTGADFDNAYYKSGRLLDNLESLLGRQLRFDQAVKIARIMRDRHENMPEQLYNANFIRALLDDFNTLDAMENVEELSPAIAKRLPSLTGAEAFRVAGMFADAAKIAHKELTGRH